MNQDHHFLASVAEFITTFDASRDIRLWTKLIEEEAAELLAAIANEPAQNVLKERADLIYVTAGAFAVAPEYNGVYTEADWLRLERAAKMAHRLTEYASLKFEFSDETTLEAFNRVHASNMSKLDDNGLPIRREDGKIMKGPNYREPDLTDLV